MDHSELKELVNQRRFDEAIILAETLFASEPECAEIAARGFDAAAGKADWTLALAWANRGLKCAPTLHDQLKALVRRAAAFMYMDDVTSAEMDLQDVVRVADEEHAKGNVEVGKGVRGHALNNLALILEKRGDHDGKIPLLKAAHIVFQTDGDPGMQAHCLVNLVWTYLLAGRPMDAAPLLDSIEFPEGADPGLKVSNQVNRALYLHQVGAHTESITLCEECLAGNPGDDPAADFWWIIALNRRATGDLVGAASAQSTALGHARRDPWPVQLMRIEAVFSEAAD